jgi:hypothetical protein
MNATFAALVDFIGDCTRHSERLAWLVPSWECAERIMGVYA